MKPREGPICENTLPLPVTASAFLHLLAPHLLFPFSLSPHVYIAFTFLHLSAPHLLERSHHGLFPFSFSPFIPNQFGLRCSICFGFLPELPPL